MTAVSESRRPKSDKLDPFGVAERLRIGAIKEKVYTERGQFAELSRRAKAHWLLEGNAVRVIGSRVSCAHEECKCQRPRCTPQPAARSRLLVPVLSCSSILGRIRPMESI